MWLVLGWSGLVLFGGMRLQNRSAAYKVLACRPSFTEVGKLTWLALGGDPAARSRRVEQFTAL